MVKKYFIAFLVGFFISAMGAGIFIYSSINSATNYKDKYSELERENTVLRESNITRQTEIDRISGIERDLRIQNSKLERINSNYAIDIAERQRIISEAGSLITGSEDAIANLERILELIEKLE